MKLLNGFAGELEKNRTIWFVLFSIFYLLSVSLSAFRHLWYDELITYNVAILPDLRAVWHAVTHGADLNPPLFPIANWLATRVFGPGEFGVRVPGILGFLVLCFSLYVFVARRAGACYGFAAMLLPMVTGAFQYASEARAYGLMLGFCGLALVSWQRAAEGSGRIFSLFGLVAALSAALLTHCYALLVLVPFGIAQLVRDYRRRRMDWAMWSALVLPLSACLTYLPLLASLQPYAMDNPVFRPTWHSLTDFYDFLLTPSLWPLVAGALIVAFAAAKRGDSSADAAGSWKTEETALALGFLAVPALAILIAAVLTHVFMLRYGLASVVAIALLFTQSASTLTRRSRPVGAALTLLLLGWSTAVSIHRIAMVMTASPEPAIALNRRADLPLVISSGVIYYELNHYAEPGLVDRLFYLTDAQTARKMTGSDVFDRGFHDLDRMFPLRGKLEDYHVFLAAHPQFLVYGYEAHELDWLLPQLLRDGAQLLFLGQHQEKFGRAALYEVRLSNSVVARTVD